MPKTARPKITKKQARIDRIRKAARDLMVGDQAAAEQWLNMPMDIWDNKTPLENAATEKGACEVENLIGRIEHGVFS